MENTQLSWVNPGLILNKSKIEGTGYKTIFPIKKDEILIVQSGRCIHISEIDTEKKAPEWYVGFQIELSVYYYPHTSEDKPLLEGIFCINHSCDPNAGFKGQITLVAMRDIEIGEEITYDYALTDIETTLEDPWTPETCLCGSEICRKQITGNDWKLSDVQQRYDNYFSTHVAAAINNGNSEGKQ
jgi:hypothetical protein